MKKIEILVTLVDGDAAWQLAQFYKRATFQTFYDMTEPHLPAAERQERAYQMSSGIESVQRALADAGYSPR